ncbi:potassium channel subfamily T member 1 [Fopius arisanus]|uniref:Potassium channel subfamily T member 1 n=2 Tax=Fopius arisanus TaxID=64838 RepID=A0A9R1TW67_9HYME|nr:PREDICTED: potassium channel subfamily T member 1-like [Fopius arisanus]
MASSSRYSSYNCLTSWDSYDRIPRVRVEYYVNENTFKERLQLYFIKNQRSSLRIRVANLFFKLLTCFLYIFRVITDNVPTFASCYGCTPGNKSDILASQMLTEEEFQDHSTINWDAILWVRRPLELWVVQVILAMVSLAEALLLAYLGYKVKNHGVIIPQSQVLINENFQILYPPMRNLFIPVFLNCWLAKHSLENMFNDLHRAMQKSQSALSQQLMILSVTLLCLVFTRSVTTHKFQLLVFVNKTRLNSSFFEQLAFTWMERQKLGGSYSSHRAQSEKHVVVCSTTLQADTIMDFLNEFYAHPLLQDYYVVLLSPMELDTTMRMILQVPIWAQRVIYIQGSCLKDGDLARARMNEAEACFVLAHGIQPSLVQLRVGDCSEELTFKIVCFVVISATTYLDPANLTDSRQCLRDAGSSPQTPITGNHLDVPRSMDTNPNLLSPEILMQRRGSRRPSILPVPDMLTSSTLHLPGQESLDHEADESEDEMDDDVPWRSPSEKIAIVKGFPPVSPFIGVSPTLCYLLKEKKPLCCLQLAQVCEHCSYRNAKEYNWQNKTIILAADYASNGIYNFIIPLRAHFRSKTSLNPIILLLERRPEIAFLDAISYFPLVYWMLGSIDCLDDLLRAGITLAENVVVVNKELSNSAEEDTLADCNTIVAVQTMFKFFPSIKSITELSQSSNMRFMQFRAHDKYALHLSKMEKREKERGSHISYMFRLPFAAGSVFSASMLDTLLYQAFVKDYVITFVRLLLGIDQAPGSGFLTSMQITKDDMWIRTYGRLYQKLCSTTYEIPIGIYRTQDTSVTDTSNDSDAESDTGVGVTYKMRRTAAAACLSNCSAREKGASAIRIFCPQYSVSIADEARDNHTQQIERAEIANLVRSRMESLNLPVADYDDVSEKRNSLSYVIINPSCDLKLEEGDIVYLVRPSPFSAQKTFERHNSRRKSNISFCSAQLVAQMSAAVASSGIGSGGSRRGSGIGLARAPPLGGTKSNSLSLPDSPTVAGSLRGRSNSLRVVDDILLRRSNSLRQGFTTRRKSSLEDIGLGALSHPTNHNPIKIALNGSIGLEVTPPEEGIPGGNASNTGILDVGLPSMPALGTGLGAPLGPPLGAGLGGSLGGLYDPPIVQSKGLVNTQQSQSNQDPQHIQGTIV